MALMENTRRLIMFILFSSVGITSVCSQSMPTKIPLHIVSVLELSEIPSWFDFARMMPDLVKYTLNDINNFTGVLDDYDLRIIYRDMHFNSGLAAKHLIEVVNEDPPKVALFGPNKSDFVASTGQIVPFFNIVQVAYFDQLPILEDYALYPNTFTVKPDLYSLDALRIAMIKHYGWGRVATITSTDNVFQDQIVTFQQSMKTHNISLASAAILTDDSSIYDIIKRFKQFDVRIVVMAGAVTTVRQVFCQAYQLGMYGSGYVWIITGATMYGGTLIKDLRPGEDPGCTKEQLIKASAGNFQLDYYTVSRSNTPTLWGKLPNTIMRDLESIRIDAGLSRLRADIGIAVDALWSLALGLNNSLKYLDMDGLQLHNYNYSDVYLQAVKRGMHEVSFHGLSGLVAFDSEGKRIGISYLRQFYNDTPLDVFSYDPRDGQITWFVDPNSIWAGGRPPKDSFSRRVQQMQASMLMLGTVITLDSLGLSLTIALFAFNIYYRNNRLMKMSSPMLNNVILAGCLLMYMEVFAAGLSYLNLSHGNSISCMVRAWLLTLGFTTLFGALFAKTYRVYVIFRSNTFNRKHIKDGHLFGLILGLLVVDVFILLPWSLIHPMGEHEVVISEQIIVEDNVILREIFHYCFNSSQGYWFAAVYIYKGLLLAFGTFLAWETRHVTITALNDSKYIGACIYNVVVICIFGVPLAHLLPTEQSTLLFALQSCLILFCTITCQCIIFVPKLQMRNQVHGRFVTDNMTSRTRGDTVVTENPGSHDANMAATIDDKSLNLAVVGTGDNRDIEEVKEENRKLRLQIATESIAIAKLRRGLQQMTGNIHFYRSGSQYVLFKTNEGTSSSCANTPFKQKP